MDAEVRQEDDGEFSLVATMVMSESDYRLLEGRTAFSIAFPKMGVPGWPSPPQPLLVVMVDSYHWDDTSILEALNAFSGAAFPVEGARYHQFSGEPPAKIVFDLLLNYKNILPVILAAYLVESVRILFGRRKKQSAERTDELTLGDQADNQPVQPAELVAEKPAPSGTQLGPPTQSASEIASSTPAKVILDFRTDSRHAPIDCDDSESSERLIEKVIRALAEVTPVAGEQQDFPPSE